MKKALAIVSTALLLFAAASVSTRALAHNQAPAVVAVADAQSTADVSTQTGVEEQAVEQTTNVTEQDLNDTVALGTNDATISQTEEVDEVDGANNEFGIDEQNGPNNDVDGGAVDNVGTSEPDGPNNGLGDIPNG